MDDKKVWFMMKEVLVYNNDNTTDKCNTMQVLYKISLYININAKSLRGSFRSVFLLDM